LVLPAVLFLAFSGLAFTLAKLHLAKPGAPTAKAVQLGDARAGQSAYAAKCAPCHGPGGRGGAIGPKLAGAPIPLLRAQTQIEVGGGVMPAGLVKGKDEADVLAYLATILAKT
jgi:mono/diheme cytochrome c family protein